mgnify:CR=1 FL=1
MLINATMQEERIIDKVMTKAIERLVSLSDIDSLVAIIERLDAVITETFAGWAPLRRMVADNRDYSTTSAVTMVAVMVKLIRGLAIEIERDRGYLSVETANAVRDALWKLEEEHKLDQGAAWHELGTAASLSLYLGEEEAKNLLSPVPSETSQALSNETNASEKAGKSPASKETDQTDPSPETQSTE